MGEFLRWIHICASGLGGQISTGGVFWIVGCVGTMSWFIIMNCGKKVLGGMVDGARMMALMIAWRVAKEL
jgi:hypothetical protein